MWLGRREHEQTSGVIAAFVLGGILTATYMRYRDLLANITAHFLGDFVLNVVLPLVSGGR